MHKSDKPLLIRTLAFSALAGMRSFSPPALLSLYLAGHYIALEHVAAQRMRTPSARIVLVIMALIEITADKLPQLPNRILPPSIVVRALTGGGVGALLWSLHQRPAWIGSLSGSAAAIANTYASFYLRRWLGRALPVSHAVSWSGVLEDGLVWISGRQLLRGLDYSRPDDAGDEWH